jgi:hypothetical protein
MTAALGAALFDEADVLSLRHLECALGPLKGQGGGHRGIVGEALLGPP